MENGELTSLETNSTLKADMEKHNISLYLSEFKTGDESMSESDTLFHFIHDYFDTIQDTISDIDTFDQSSEIVDSLDMEKIDIPRTFIKGNILHIYNHQGEHQNIILTGIKEVDTAFQKTQDNLESIKNEISKDKFLGGALVLSYMAISEGIYRISNIRLQGKNINVPGNITGSKWELSQRIFRILSRQGYAFDPIEKTFNKIDAKLYEQFKRVSQKGVIKGVTYKQYRTLREAQGFIGEKQILSETKFKIEQAKLLSEVERLEKKYTEYTKKQKQANKSVVSKSEFLFHHEIQTKLGRLGLLGNTTQHMLFLPIFLESIYKNSQDLASYGQALAEYQLFQRGFKGGSKLGSRAPGGFKVPASLIGGLLGGGAMVVGGEEIGSSLNLDKHFWKIFPEREDFAMKLGLGEHKSFLGHALTLGTAHDAVDKAGVNRNGIIDFFFDSRVEIDTDIREYMNTAVGRDVYKYNIEVDRYSEEIDESLFELVNDYRNNTGPFRKYKYVDINTYTSTNKYNTFLQELAEVLHYNPLLQDNVLEIQYYRSQQQSIYDTFKGALDRGGLVAQNFEEDEGKDLRMILHNYVQDMKVDQNFVDTQKGLNKNRKDIIDLILEQKIQIDSMPELSLLSTEELDYLNKVRGRLINREDVFIGFKEDMLFQRLMEIPNMENLLNLIVDYKREKIFLQNLYDSHMTDGVKWGLI